MGDTCDFKKTGFSRKVRRDERQYGVILAAYETEWGSVVEAER